MSNSDRFMDQAEIMERLRISRTTLYFLRKEGRFPRPVKSFGRRMLWLRAAVEDFERREMLQA